MSSGTQVIQDLFSSLESVIVNLFRLFEILREITREERQILLDGKADALIDLAKRKEGILTEMESSDEARRSITNQLAEAVEINPDTATLSDLLKKIDFVDVEQVSRLQEGILALQSEIREINNGNYALATLNINRLDAVQSYILSLFSPPTYYRPNNQLQAKDPPASWGMDHRA
jgi:flagellar biosynthesis/type III secretory pathway chaperone